LQNWAEQLAALPIAPGQSVDFQAGQRNGYGYLGVTISVLDSTGHCQCRAVLESSLGDICRSKHTLEVDILIEPNAIDRFIAELTAIVQLKHQGEASLLGMDSLTPN